MRIHHRVYLTTVLLLGVAIVAPGVILAQPTKGDPAEEFGVRIARVKYGGGGDWYNDPSSIPNWLAEFERRIGVPTVQGREGAHAHRTRTCARIRFST